MTPLLPLVVLVPLLAAAVAFAWPRRAAAIGLLAGGATLALGVALLAAVARGGPQRHVAGGWVPPLGITLAADGVAAAFVLVTGLVAFGAALVAAGARGAHAMPAGFWPLWLLLWAALDTLFISRDLFNIYVGLELVGLSAVALVALGRRPAALHGAMHYLFAGAAGAACVLLGTALAYGAAGSLALDDLLARATVLPASAFALLVAGLLLKMAVVPLHGWLPAAHANAPPPVSAALSALVVKAPCYVLLRLWAGGDLAPVVAALGGVAVLWGAWQALRAARLKLLVAYSTVAQVGYLALFLPLAQASAAAAGALALLALAHALAKAGMFLAVGAVAESAGHDRLADLPGSPSARPRAVATLALAGVTLVGLPPSAAFAAKWVLLDAAVGAEAWPVVAVTVLGTLGAAGYVFRVLGPCLAATGPGRDAGDRSAHRRDLVPLALAAAGLLLGLGAGPLFPLLEAAAP